MKGGGEICPFGQSGSYHELGNGIYPRRNHATLFMNKYKVGNHPKTDN